MSSQPTEGFTSLLAAVPIGAEDKARLHTLMSGKDRFYHGLDHVSLLYGRHLLYAAEAGFDDPVATRMIASAIAFHDCIYEANRNDNEESSAKVWLETSTHIGISEHERAWVADTIRSTSDHLGYGLRSESVASPSSLEALRLWMLDLDLTPFGEEPDVFDRNARLLRAEAPHLDDETFETARLRLLRRFADAPIIFRTPVIAKHFDASARSNLARHLRADLVK